MGFPAANGSGSAADHLGAATGATALGKNPDFVWGLIAGIYTGNVLGVLMVLAFVPLFAAILRIPFAILTPLNSHGVRYRTSYAVHNSMLDIWYMMLFGVVGYVFKKLDYPLAPTWGMAGDALRRA